MRKSQHLSVKCARAVTPKVVDVWITYVKKLFQESGQCGHVSKNFSNRPWNCNETVFFPYLIRLRKYWQKEGAMKKVIRLVGESGQEYITVSGAGLASRSGVTLPSYIVYRCKHLYNTWCQSGPAGALHHR